ncbi:helicase-related protein [Sorangium cellulosum]|uniref:Helicase n=1 Tax=Sorangium cellulosum TaxID=56 RepID=A0A150QET6_SORCE|nr:helicase-related protein [Sorangium cellulosum]KYF66494.1 helicase [Sorangium cellulosum]
MADASAITAVLGPTNTGKTHRAIERMLAHDSGMIGLPLRLLAREVYDRVTTRVGEARVALVTGEEKRVPRRPDYWVCTVEAMPIDLEVDFLAIDEIQLAAHDQRGHVFTERLLLARGRRETWFLGADTMRPLVSDLVPTAKFVQHPRLSRLTSAGAGKLSRLPPRSAVVAFSTPQVYEIAERLRAQRGGAAVVLGALSPRTRNAQVAMFQSGEVDYLVATDAIGMGLNLDVRHVAFAALRKFDGRDVRDLDPAELAQIAGRAGRHLADGTFGTVAPLSLPDGIAAAIEAHRFPAVRRLRWRNSELDRSSIDALLASLREPPPARSLKLVHDAEDAAALSRLAEDPEIRARARGSEAVGLLWEVCRIPDFRKLLFESHVALLAEIYAQLSGPSAALDPGWMAARVAEIDEVGGDIDTLITRIASIRTWTYISNHGRWVRDAGAWQDRTRAIEDRLSDALHERLVQRFVERGGGAAGRLRAASSARAGARPAQRRPEIEEPVKVAPDHPFARIAAMRALLAPGPAAPAPEDDRARWVESIVGAPHERFSVDVAGRILDGEQLLGQLARGPALLLPDVRLAALDDLGPGARSRVLRRLVAFARDLVEELLAPLRSPGVRGLQGAARGIVYQLEQGLGTAAARDAGEQIAELAPEDRALLAAHGIEVGERVIYAQQLLRRGALERRLALCAAWFDRGRVPACPAPGAVSVAVARGVDPRAYAAIGYPVFGTRAIRADVAERVHRALVSGEPAARLSSWMGCPAREAPRVAASLLG